MTFSTSIFVEPESPISSYSILHHHREESLIPASATSESSSLSFVETSSSAESFDIDCDDNSNDIDDLDGFITYQTLNDCPIQEESLFDDSGSESDASMLRENSDDSLCEMLASAGFSVKQKKRVTFKPMVKVFHFESAELAEKYALQEAERQRLAKIAEESKSFVSKVKFFVCDDDDNDDDGFDY